MKTKVLAVLALGMLVTGGMSNAHAAPVELIKAKSVWYYKTLDFNLWTPEDDWSTAADYSAVTWTEAVNTWDKGPALFGNLDAELAAGNTDYQKYLAETGPWVTYWEPNTDLALLQNFNVAGPITGSATLNVAVDNGFVIFLNGTEIARQTAELYTKYWEYELTIDGSLFELGANELAVLAADHGSLTAFDLQLTADANPVPVPATVVLLATALTGLAGTRLRRKNK